MFNRILEAAENESLRLPAATLFAILLASMLLGSNPAGAQTAGPLTNERARIIDSDDADVIVNQVIIAGVDCTVDDGATILVQDEDRTRIRLTDDAGTTVGNVNITSSDDQIVARGSRDGDLGSIDTIEGGRDPDFNPGSGTVIGSTGIECDDDESRTEAGVSSGNVQAANLIRLSCEELLQRFRDDDEREAGGNGQYSNGSALADTDVQDRIVFCLEREIVNVPDDDLPDTGGLPLVGLALLGLASLIVGASVIRGVGRGE